jgi:hypothetical protein
MAGGAKNKGAGKSGQAAFKVVLEHESTEEAEDRLLQVYELLLGLTGPLGPSSEEGELT